MLQIIRKDKAKQFNNCFFLDIFTTFAKQTKLCNTMALINCSECGKQVSDKAASCPSCGNPINQQTG